MQDEDSPSLFADFLGAVGWTYEKFNLWLHNKVYHTFSGTYIGLQGRVTY